MHNYKHMNIKKNLPLIVALAIPMVLTAIIAVSIYLPGVGKSPEHDFVYTVYDYRDVNGTLYYDVKDGKIVQESIAMFPEGPSGAPSKAMTGSPSSQLYIYDVQSDTSKLLTMDEAAKLIVDPSRTSPDGYRVEYGSSGGVFPFFDGGYDNNQYLLGNNRRIKTSVSGYDNNFLGWVINQ